MSSLYANLDRLAACPANHSPSVFFDKYIEAYLAPIYALVARSLTRRQQPSFRKIWAWETENLLRECGTKEELGETQEYATHPRDLAVPGASYRLSEIYKSAFMRTLAWIAFAGHLSQAEFKRISLMACPVDPSLWDVTTQPPPSWWPRWSPRGIDYADKTEDLIAAPWTEIRELVKLELRPFEQSPGRILAAEGAGRLEEDTKSTGARLWFSLLGFAYRVSGPRIPSADEIADLITTGPRYIAQIDSPYSASVLDAAVDGALVHSSYSWEDASSLEITALVSRFESYPIYTWQWYRAHELPFALSPLLAGPGVTVRRNESSWVYIVGKHEVARIYDWRIGALERDPKNFFPLHGQVVEIDFRWLSEVVAKKNMSLGYLLRTKVKVQKRSYETAKEFEHTELLEISRIITTGKK